MAKQRMKIIGKPMANRRQTEGKWMENRQKMDSKQILNRLKQMAKFLNLFLPVKWVKEDWNYCEKVIWVI